MGRGDVHHTRNLLAVLLWWLLDKSERQWATRRFVIAADDLVREALFGNGRPA